MSAPRIGVQIAWHLLALVVLTIVFVLVLPAPVAGLLR